MRGNLQLKTDYYSCRYVVDDFKVAGRKENMAPMWKKLMKHVDPGEPMSFLDHVYLECTQRECRPTKITLRNTERCSNHEFLREQLRNYLRGRETSRKNSRLAIRYGRSRDKSAWEDIATWRFKKTEQLHKISTPCLNDHNFKKDGLETVGEFTKVCSQIELKCLYLARSG